MLLEVVIVVILNAIIAAIVPIVTNDAVHVLIHYITICKIVRYEIALYDGRYTS